MDTKRNDLTQTLLACLLCAFLAVFSGCAGDGDKKCCTDGTCAECKDKKGDDKKCCTDGSCDKCKEKKASEHPQGSEHPKSTEHPEKK